jgi:ADP-heptose:LPS heptosyltransferase
MKILVIRRDNIGDLVCTTPLFDALRKHFPDARICALVNSYNQGVLAGHPSIDCIYAYTKLKHRGVGQSVLAVLWGKLRLYWALRQECFNYVICAGSGYSANAIRLAKAARPEHIISYVNEGSGYDSVIDMPVVRPTDRRWHEVEDVNRLLLPLGVDAPLGPLSLYVSPHELEPLLQLLGTEDKPVLAVHISAREASREWPSAHYVQVIRHMCALGWRVLLLWAPGATNDPRHPGDDAKAESIMAATAGLPVIPFRTTRLEQLTAAFSLSSMAVCADGGGLHVAAGVQVPVVGLFEHLAKKYERWYPWGVPSRVLTSGSDTDWEVRHISPEQVIQACLELSPSPLTVP